MKMRLYINCSHCKSKIILQSAAKTRRELALQWGNNFTINCLHCHFQVYYSVQDVFAETISNNAPGAAIIGGLIGLLIGPEGALIGSAIGGGIGYKIDEIEKKMVESFNNSR